MKFRVISKKTSTGAHSPIQVVEQSTGNGVAWINRYLDREYVRRLSNKSLFTYAHSLLYFVRWWESVHQTGEISTADLTESTLVDYLRFQSSRQPPPSATTINDRVAMCRSCYPQSVPQRSLSGRPRLPSALPAPQADGPGTPKVRAEQTQSAGTQAQHRSSLGR